jgi:phosphoglycerate dehydrogenase-like enzyme
MVGRATNLKLVIRGGVGTDNIDKVACKERGIKVANTPKASSVAVAELAMAMMLAIPNRIVEAQNSMKEGKFLKKELKRTELFQKTLGLLGVGRIGTEVAARCQAFGMVVIAADPAIKDHPIAKVVPLEEMVAKADYISIHCPLVDSTRNLINKDLIAKMKKGVIIINTGRAKVVVAEDLVAALKSGQVRAYGTDVWYDDKEDPACQVRQAPNVLMAPHIGASSEENLLRIGDTVVNILSKWK